MQHELIPYEHLSPLPPLTVAPTGTAQSKVTLFIYKCVTKHPVLSEEITGSECDCGMLETLLHHPHLRVSFVEIELINKWIQ